MVIFAEVQCCIYADIVVWASKIVKKCADVIYGWSQKEKQLLDYWIFRSKGKILSNPPLVTLQSKDPPSLLHTSDVRIQERNSIIQNLPERRGCHFIIGSDWLWSFFYFMCQNQITFGSKINILKGLVALRLITIHKNFLQEF